MELSAALCLPRPAPPPSESGEGPAGLGRASATRGGAVGGAGGRKGRGPGPRASAPRPRCERLPVRSRPELQPAAVLSAGVCGVSRGRLVRAASPWGPRSWSGPARMGGERTGKGSKRPAPAALLLRWTLHESTQGPALVVGWGSVRRGSLEGLLAILGGAGPPSCVGAVGSRACCTRPRLVVPRGSRPDWCPLCPRCVNAHPHGPPPRRRRQASAVPRAASADATFSWRVAA